MIASHKNSLIDQLESLTASTGGSATVGSTEDIPCREFVVRNQPAKFYTIPLFLCDYIVSMEFCLLAVQHRTNEHVSIVENNVSTEGQDGTTETVSTIKKVTSMIRNLESRLEILVMPSRDIDLTASIISQFEMNVGLFSLSSCLSLPNAFK